MSCHRPDDEAVAKVVMTLAGCTMTPDEFGSVLVDHPKMVEYRLHASCYCDAMHHIQKHIPEVGL